ISLDVCALPGARLLLTPSIYDVEPVNLGFAFRYYGVSLGSVAVSSTGMLGFGSPSSSSVNVTIPTVAEPNGFVAGFWDELRSRTSSSLCVAFDGAAPSRRMLVQWTDFFPTSEPTAHVTFQMVLDETADTIEVYY